MICIPIWSHRVVPYKWLKFVLSRKTVEGVRDLANDSKTPLLQISVLGVEASQLVTRVDCCESQLKRLLREKRTIEKKDVRANDRQWVYANHFAMLPELSWQNGETSVGPGRSMRYEKTRCSRQWCDFSGKFNHSDKLSGQVAGRGQCRMLPNTRKKERKAEAKCIMKCCWTTTASSVSLKRTWIVDFIYLIIWTAVFMVLRTQHLLLVGRLDYL